MRGVDKAHAVPSESNPNPDFTAISPLLLKDRNGFYHMLGNYLPICSDDPVKRSDKRILGRFRRLAGARDMLIVSQMKFDIEAANTYGYSEPKIVIPKDHGAGTGDFNATVAIMVENGIKVVKDQTISNVKGKKLSDFLGFTNACQNGLVSIYEETFDDESLAYIWAELEKFDGVTKSTQTRKDDFVDAIAVCFNALAVAKRAYKTPSFTSTESSPTLSVGLLRNNNANQNS